MNPRDPKADNPFGTRPSGELFLPEALAHVDGRSALGPVLAITPVPLQLFAVLVALVMTALLSFAAIMPFTRHQTIQGRLSASAGMVTLQSPGEGVISDLKVMPGQRVVAGESLLAIQMSGTGDTARGAQRVALDQVRRERHLLKLTQEREDALVLRSIVRDGEQLKNLKQRAAMLRDREVLLENIADTQRKRVERFEALRARGDVSESDFEEAVIVEQKARDDVLLLREQLQSTLVETTRVDHSILERQSTRELNRVKARRERLAIDVRLNELDTPQIVLLESPVDGTVTALNRNASQTTKSGEDLLRIMPADGKLLARFFVASSVVGLIQPGQPVQLRFDAFPHERYGSQLGTLRSVSPSAVMDSRAEEAALFLIEVELERDTVRANGKEQPLLPDMSVEGSIELERRTLLGWIIAPVQALVDRS